MLFLRHSVVLMTNSSNRELSVVPTESYQWFLQRAISSSYIELSVVPTESYQ